MIVDNFVDYVKLSVSSGKGGRGSTHLRREKYIPKGGPDGGDGGDGGNIIIKGNANLWTLQSFRFKNILKQEMEGMEEAPESQELVAKILL